MAAHEILRQVWLISIQAFMALDICAQSMVASFLGQVVATTCMYPLFASPLRLPVPISSCASGVSFCYAFPIPGLYCP